MREGRAEGGDSEEPVVAQSVAGCVGFGVLASGGHVSGDANMYLAWRFENAPNPRLSQP